MSYQIPVFIICENGCGAVSMVDLQSATGLQFDGNLEGFTMTRCRVSCPSCGELAAIADFTGDFSPAGHAYVLTNRGQSQDIENRLKRLLVLMQRGIPFDDAANTLAEDIDNPDEKSLFNKIVDHFRPNSGAKAAVQNTLMNVSLLLAATSAFGSGHSSFHVPQRIEKAWDLLTTKIAIDDGYTPEELEEIRELTPDCETLERITANNPPPAEYFEGDMPRPW
jgi:hypothetical protein